MVLIKGQNILLIGFIVFFPFFVSCLKKVAFVATGGFICADIPFVTIKGGSRCAEKSRKVLMMMKGVKLG